MLHKLLNKIKDIPNIERAPKDKPESDTDKEDRIARNIHRATAMTTAAVLAPAAIIGQAALVKKGYKYYKDLTATPTEKAAMKFGSVKDVIKNKIMEHPKTSTALGAAGLIGAGYGTYRYLKSKKNKDKAK